MRKVPKSRLGSSVCVQNVMSIHQQCLTPCLPSCRIDADANGKKLRVLGASGKEKISKQVAAGLSAAVKQLSAQADDHLLDQVTALAAIDCGLL